MDLTTVGMTEPIDRVSGFSGSQLVDRCDQSSKADRLDMIVGDVLARQSKETGDVETMIPEEVPRNRYSSEHPQPHHHHDLCDDVPPTEADVPLHEWVSALTHPLLGPYPNGVTPRILDRLATDAGVVRFPDNARRRWHKMWSSSNHLCVYLSDEVKSGRLRRVRFGHYAGAFDNHVTCPPVNCNPTGITIKAETNGCGLETNRVVQNGDVPKDENDLCLSALDIGHFTAPRPFPINVMSLLGPLSRDRASSFGSQNGTTSRRRTYRSTFSNGDELLDESHDSASKNHKLLQPRRPRTKPRRPSSTLLDEFGLPSLLEDPSFANVVFSMGIDVQSWSVEQAASFVQDFGFADGAEAFAREEIDGTALMLLKRVDVLDGLRLKIGPAVKLYRYIRALQKLVSNKNGNGSHNGSSNGDV